MKQIGIIGGLSWESTIEYYRIINQETNRILGGLHSAKILMRSYDFALIEELQRHGEWSKITKILVDSAQKLIGTGADVIVIATNTLHKLAPQVQQEISVPIFHIADATANVILQMGYKKVLLLGTKYTMQEDFYKGKLQYEYEINVITPTQREQEHIHTIIFEELCRGIKLENSKEIILTIIEKAKLLGAEAVILGCTELPNLIQEASLPVLNTAYIHSIGIVQYALEQSKERVIA